MCFWFCCLSDHGRDSRGELFKIDSLGLIRSVFKLLVVCSIAHRLLMNLCVTSGYFVNWRISDNFVDGGWIRRQRPWGRWRWALGRAAATAAVAAMVSQPWAFGSVTGDRGDNGDGPRQAGGGGGGWIRVSRRLLIFTCGCFTCTKKSDFRRYFVPDGWKIRTRKPLLTAWKNRYCTSVRTKQTGIENVMPWMQFKLKRFRMILFLISIQRRNQFDSVWVVLGLSFVIINYIY